MSEARLRLHERGRPTRDVVVRDGFVLGRGSACDIRVDDEEVSREHARFSLDARGLWITDLASRNGTRIGDSPARAHEPVRIPPGSRLQIGGVEIDVLHAPGGEPTDAPTTRVSPPASRAPQRRPGAEPGHTLASPRASHDRPVPPAPRPAPAPPATSAPRPAADEPRPVARAPAAPDPASGTGVFELPDRARRAPPEASSPADAAPPKSAPGLLEAIVSAPIRGVGWLIDKLFTRRDHGGDPEAPPGTEEVLLGASAPRRVRPGSEFTARFTAHLERDLQQVAATLQSLSPRATHHPGVRRCRWRFGTEVLVALQIRGADVAPARGRRFVWRGDPIVLDFDVTVDDDAAIGVTVQKFDVFVEGFRVATIRVDLEIASDAKDGTPASVHVRPARTAFASYASADRDRVLDRVASVRLAADLDVFLDCLMLRAGDRYETVLLEQIRQRDLFLLFWSEAASQSQWVRVELDTALDTKGEDCMQLHPLDSFDEASVPEQLRHLHFGDLLMDLRRAYRER